MTKFFWFPVSSAHQESKMFFVACHMQKRIKFVLQKTDCIQSKKAGLLCPSEKEHASCRTSFGRVFAHGQKTAAFSKPQIWCLLWCLSVSHNGTISSDTPGSDKFWQFWQSIHAHCQKSQAGDSVVRKLDHIVQFGANLS